MRIIFCGTPDYAVPSLKRLHQLQPQHQLVAVLSQPDRPKGRSARPSPPPVVDTARQLGLADSQILQPQSINAPEILAQLEALKPDLFCVVAYGMILRRKALAIPALFPLNAHGSLLPKYRGAAPIQAALLAGEQQTGVSIMRMERGLDSGPYLLQRSVTISSTDTAGTLHDKLAELSAECFVQALKLLEQGACTWTAQDQAAVTYSGKLDKNSGRIDWSREATFLERFVRAMDPWPGAWTMVSGPTGVAQQRLRILEAKVISSPAGAVAGQVKVLGERLSVGCGAGALELQKVQAEGKKAMAAAEFLRGLGRTLDGLCLHS